MLLQTNKQNEKNDHKIAQLHEFDDGHFCSSCFFFVCECVDGFVGLLVILHLVGAFRLICSVCVVCFAFIRTHTCGQSIGRWCVLVPTETIKIRKHSVDEMHTITRKMLATNFCGRREKQEHRVHVLFLSMCSAAAMRYFRCFFPRTTTVHNQQKIITIYLPLFCIALFCLACECVCLNVCGVCLDLFRRVICDFRTRLRETYSHLFLR